ncbi:hypothetical protein CARUB_v10022032mg [Capsella rubella]|uniref:Transmembrane protein n=2 Tax=Capsella rubella TaxID=81985 RepID=R0GFT2_9BRAS|nr:hypothetical protein CARUB_v10022032mg [Capsella rubella]
MGSKKPSHTLALLLSLLILIILTLSSQVIIVEATSRILANGNPIIRTPPSKSCGALTASWSKYRRPCKRPLPRTP